MSIRKRLSTFLFLIALGLVATTGDLLSAEQDSTKSVHELVAQLTSEDQKVADAAEGDLFAMGPDVIKQLFEKLLVAEWTLKPRLLEVLSTHGREFAKDKLAHGYHKEKIYAALVYELSVSCAAEEFDYDSAEFKAMVKALLSAINSEDKCLRAAAATALVYDEDSTVFFDHFHEIVPALISSFDTELIIDRHNRGGPVQVVLLVIANNLSVFVGDRFIEVEREVFTRSPEAKIDDPRDPQAYMRKILSDNRSTIAKLRAEWETWWKEHSKLTAVEIGSLMIERSLRVLAADPPPKDDWRDDWNTMAADWCLQKWAGSGVAVADWAQWWDKNKSTYKGPIRRRE